MTTEHTHPDLDRSSSGYARALLENMVAAHGELRRAGVASDARRAVGAVFDEVAAALAHLPLERLRAESDFVLHAEGPGAAHQLPWLSALAWLMTTAESNVRTLSAAALDLWGADGSTLARELDLRVPGVLPGSIWLGIKVLAPSGDMLPEDVDLMQRLTQHLAALPELTRHIGDESIDAGIAEVAPDPAMRDVQLAALLRFAPTGKRGIHTVEIGSGRELRAALSQRERVVLREALSKPDRSRSIEGRFTGDVRVADLDKTRIHLRNVAGGVGTLRCVMPELSAAKAGRLLGSRVTVEGRYQVDAHHRPRLMFVEKIHAQRVPTQREIDSSVAKMPRESGAQRVGSPRKKRVQRPDK